MRERSLEDVFNRDKNYSFYASRKSNKNLKEDSEDDQIPQRRPVKIEPIKKFSNAEVQTQIKQARDVSTQTDAAQSVAVQEPPTIQADAKTLSHHKCVTMYKAGDLILFDDYDNKLGVLSKNKLDQTASKNLLDGQSYFYSAFHT